MTDIRSEIAARYGIAPDKVAPVSVIAAGVSGLPDPAIPRTRNERRAEKHRIYIRNIKFQRVARKEFVEPPPPSVVTPKAAPSPVEKKKPGPKSKSEHYIQRDNLMAQLVAEGLTVKQIAARLNMQLKTTHNALSKLGLRATAEPVKPKKPKKPKDSAAVLHREAETAARVEAIRRLRAEGKVTDKIAEAIGMSRDAVRYLAKKNGISLHRVPKPPKPKRAPIDPQEVAAMYASGMTVEAIRKALRRAYGSVQKALDDAGVKREGVTPATRVLRLRIRELHAKGLTNSAIAAETGACISSVALALKHMGLTLNRHKPKHRDENAANAAWTLYYDKGLSMARIGAELDMPRSRVHRLIESKRKAA